MAKDPKTDELLDTAPITAEELALLQALKRKSAGAAPESVRIYHRDGCTELTLSAGQSRVVGRAAPADVVIRDHSLSRQHACFERVEGALWVEDLSSTNGTWLAGERVERSRLEPGDELTLGTVFAVVHSASQAGKGGLRLGGHDAFLDEIEAETARARSFDRTVALVLVRGESDQGASLGSWAPKIEELLRAFDRMALYSGDTLEILLPELNVQEAERRADQLLSAHATLRCGVAVLPDHAASAGELLERARRALQRSSARQRLCVASSEISDPGGPSSATAAGPVTSSPAMRQVFDTVSRVASSAIPVLIVGETGTGKEVIARAIHEQSSRATRPMRCVNCGAIPSQLVESTLFGHEKGAFTGATERAAGVFESAAGGTVLLDEIGELPASAQVALLRVLEDKRVTRVGSNREIEVDARVIAATHRDLEQMCESGGFREDLFYRLNAMTIDVPPLRERAEDIASLVALFIERANRANDRQIAGTDDAAMALLQRYDWPGNARELRNAIERAVVIAQEDVITVEDLPARLRRLHQPEEPDEVPTEEAPPSEPASEEREVNLRQEMARHEADLIRAALEQAGGDRKLAARTLGLPVRTLAHKMRAHGIRLRGEGPG